MSGDSDDPVIARLWRDVSSEMPGTPLDRRILTAARARAQRRTWLPLAAAMAACLVLAVTMMPARRPPALPEGYTYGLDLGSLEAEGRANAEAAQQQMIREMPGGSLYSKISYP